MEKSIRIIVVGRPKSGKTTLQLWLVQQLMNIGLPTQMLADEYESPAHLTHAHEQLPARLEGLRKRGIEIVVECRQMRRDGTLHNFEENFEDGPSCSGAASGFEK